VQAQLHKCQLEIIIIIIIIIIKSLKSAVVASLRNVFILLCQPTIDTKQTERHGVCRNSAYVG
jgi:hypothetical protein